MISSVRAYLFDYPNLKNNLLCSGQKIQVHNQPLTLYQPIHLIALFIMFRKPQQMPYQTWYMAEKSDEKKKRVESPSCTSSSKDGKQWQQQCLSEKTSSLISLGSELDNAELVVTCCMVGCPLGWSERTELLGSPRFVWHTH
jgi:hypothetical protein